MFKSTIFMRVARLYLIGHRCDDIVHPFRARCRSPNIVNELGVSVRISALSCAQWVICVLHLTMRDWAHKYTQHTRRECTRHGTRSGTTTAEMRTGDAIIIDSQMKVPPVFPVAARVLDDAAAADKVCTDYGHVPMMANMVFYAVSRHSGWGDLCTSLHFIWNSIGNYSKTLLYD